MAEAGPTATVFGANGFVGRALTAHLKAQGWDVREITRGDLSWQDGNLGHAFYTVGLTADFRSRPFDTIDAHVTLLGDILRRARFASFVYTSSTRVYMTMPTTDEEVAVPTSPANPDHLYNLSKLMGESVCLGSGLANVRVARLSNVFGRDLASESFLTTVLREAAATGRVTLRTSLASEKDYVWVGDVARALEAIAVRGSAPITNVAYGRNTTHSEIMAGLGALMDVEVSVAPGAPAVGFPQIETGLLDALDAGSRTPLLAMLGDLIADFRR
jgi:nucleoside-diphosphate-sugar epimerase